MNAYDENPERDPQPEADPRVIAVHRLVDLERQHHAAQREAERRQKQAAIIGEELRQARDELSGLLGYPSNSDAKAMSGEEARAIAEARRVAERMNR